MDPAVWIAYTIFWIITGCVLVGPTLIAIRTIIVVEILKWRELDLANSTAASIIAGGLTFLFYLFFMWLIFL